MSWVYILQSEKNSRFYIGSTEDVDKRLNHHNNGYVFSTKSLRPWKLVFKQEVENISKARIAELRLKRYKRKDFIEKIVKEGCFRDISSSGRASDS